MSSEFRVQSSERVRVGGKDSRETALIPRISYLIPILIFVLLMPAVAKEQVTFWYGATAREKKAYEQLVTDFNRTHPNIEVRGTLVPQPYVERKLLLSVAGGVPPDVVRFYTHLGGEMMSRGGLEPLDDLVRRDRFDTSDFFPIGIKQNTYEGHLYGLPWILSPNALFYNKKLFAEAHLKPPTTWDELVADAVKLTVRKPDGSIDRLGFMGLLDNPTNFHTYLWQRGGEPLSPDLKHVQFTTPEAIDTLSWMQDTLIKLAGPTQPSVPLPEASKQAFRNAQIFSDTYVGAAQDSFGLEKVAMKINSPYQMPDLKTYFKDLQYGVVPLPGMKQRAIEVIGNALVIPRDSKHRDAAWEFIKFASSREQILKICAAASRIPARRSAAMDPSFYSDPIMKVFVDQIDYGRTTPIAPGYREASGELARAIEDVFNGKMTPAQALRDKSVKAQQILDIANEDMNKLPPVPWRALGACAAGLLAAMFAAGAWYVLKHTSRSRLARKEALTFFVFLLPWIVGFLVFTLGTTLASLVFSFAKWDILNPARLVGMRNFADLFTNDPQFYKALYNTLYYAAFSIPLSIIGGLTIAVLMNQKLKGITFFRAIYYLPVVVSGVATALLWQFIFNPSNGLLNRALAMLGFHNLPQWLLDPVWTKPAFIVMGLWGLGGSMMIYLAGLNAIPDQLYEAATIDGCSAWQKFKNVTIPLLTPTIFYQLIIGTMSAFQFFTPAYVMMRGGGGPDDSTLFYSLYLFKNSFEWLKMGYASALAWVLFAIVLAVTLLQFKGSGRWVYYEGKSED